MSQAKLDEALKYLGEKWVFHPKRRIPKGNYETVLNRVDVAETVRRWRYAQEGGINKVWKLKNG